MYCTAIMMRTTSLYEEHRSQNAGLPIHQDKAFSNAQLANYGTCMVSVGDEGPQFQKRPEPVSCLIIVWQRLQKKTHIGVIATRSTRKLERIFPLPLRHIHKYAPDLWKEVPVKRLRNQDMSTSMSLLIWLVRKQPLITVTIWGMVFWKQHIFL